MVNEVIPPWSRRGIVYPVHDIELPSTSTGEPWLVQTMYISYEQPSKNGAVNRRNRSKKRGAHKPQNTSILLPAEHRKPS